MISRLSGDEFVAVISGIPRQLTKEIAAKTCERLDQVFAQPFVMGARKVDLTASKGLSLFPEDGDTAADLLQRADAAMYQAKVKGVGLTGYYSSELHQVMLQRLEVERSLLPAVKNGDFMLHYQPVINQYSNTLYSVEALVRWVHPVHGLLPPGVFIEIAEESALIEDLGKWVLQQACKDFKDWLDQGINLTYLSVNISTRQLNNPHFISVVSDILEQEQLDSKRLTLEVTETALIENHETSITILNKLRKMGVKISVDDFGTGYASLGYLKTLPADFLKIDRLFVKDLPGDKRDGAIISALATLAEELGLSLIAEGVETKAQADYFYTQNIHMIQGFYYSKPLSASDFLKYYHDFKKSNDRLLTVH